MAKKLDFLMAGIGGQGTILSSDILAEVGAEAGFDTKKAEVHGMAQRGGAVESHVRWGERVYSPLVERGEVDYLIGFEMLEAARWWHYLHPGSVALVNRYRVDPPAVSLGKARYPEPEEIEGLLSTCGARVKWVEATAAAVELGSPAVVGVVLLGALSRLLEVDIPEEKWLEVVERLVPAKFVELNRRAFLRGRELV